MTSGLIAYPYTCILHNIPFKIVKDKPVCPNLDFIKDYLKQEGYIVDKIIPQCEDGEFLGYAFIDLVLQYHMPCLP
jgi:hypothetical protein